MFGRNRNQALLIDAGQTGTCMSGQPGAGVRVGGLDGTVRAGVLAGGRDGTVLDLVVVFMFMWVVAVALLGVAPLVVVLVEVAVLFDVKEPDQIVGHKKRKVEFDRRICATESAIRAGLVFLYASAVAGCKIRRSLPTGCHSYAHEKLLPIEKAKVRLGRLFEHPHRWNVVPFESEG